MRCNLAAPDCSTSSNREAGAAASDVALVMRRNFLGGESCWGVWRGGVTEVIMG